MADDVKELLVRVSATTELLRSNLVQAEREIDRFSRSTEAATGRVENSFRRVGQASGAQRAGLQQLGYQLGDVATMYSLGARPMQIFASQSGQVLQAVQLTLGGTSKFAAFLGGSWGMALAAGATLMAPFIAKLLEGDQAAATFTAALRDLEGQANRSVNALNQLRGLQKMSIEDSVVQAQMEMNKLTERKLALELAISKRGIRRGNQIQFVSAELEELKQVESDMLTLRGYILRGQANLRQASRAAPAARAAGGGGGGGGRIRSGGGGRIRSGGGGISRVATDPLASVVGDANKVVWAGVASASAAWEEMADREWEIARELVDKRIQYDFEERQAMLARVQAIEERQIEMLSGLFERAFRGGTKAIWQDFKDIGLAVISQLMAKFVLARVSGKGFSLGDAFPAVLTSVLGFADGGRPPVGRVSVVGERGPELFIPDAAGTIIPNHMLGGGGTVINISAPGATAETVAMMRRVVAEAAPTIVAAATNSTTRQMTRRRI